MIGLFTINTVLTLYILEKTLITYTICYTDYSDNNIGKRLKIYCIKRKTQNKSKVHKSKLLKHSKPDTQYNETLNRKVCFSSHYI